MCQYNYVDEDKADRIKNFKYNSQDLSVLYNHVLSKLANKCLDFIPEWIAYSLTKI